MRPFQRTKRFGLRRAWTGLGVLAFVGALCFGGLVVVQGPSGGGAASAAVTASAPSLPPGAVHQPGPISPEDAFGVPVGHKIPVGNLRNPSEVGYVAWGEFNGDPVPGMAPITDSEGALIGYWLPAYGWVELSQAQAPGFDPQALVAQARQEAAAAAAKLHRLHPNG